MSKEHLIDFLYLMLEYEDFETFLERFDLTPDEVFIHLLECALIDENDVMELSREIEEDLDD